MPKFAFHIDPGLLRKGLLPGAKLDVFFPGFPTLKHIRHTVSIANFKGMQISCNIRKIS